jgi:hypothetical protein
MSDWPALLFQGKPMPELEVPAHIAPRTSVLEHSGTVASESGRKISLNVFR